MRPSQTILVLEALRSSFSGPLYRKGVELSSNDRSTVLDIYLQWLCLMVDLGYLRHDALQRDARRLLTDMLAADVLELNNAFAEFLHLVRCQESRGFKALCRRISTHLYNLVKCDIAKMTEGDVYAAQRLVQLSSYTSRMSLVDIDLTQQCLEDYMEIEENIPSVYPERLCRSLNKIIKRWMKSFDPDRIHFQHGPGGVAGLGRTTLEFKYKSLTYDQMLTYAFGEPWWALEPIRCTCDRISQTIFVPKSYKTFRTISMEEPTLQYCQQGVWGEIDRVVGSSRYLREHIGFHEQERNQQLAKEGSFRRNYATIDLSAASDSVSYVLVKKLFKGTKLLRFIMATRSRRTLLPDGQLVTLKKFAPMGSSLCFPIETIIFAAICQHVTRGRGVPGAYSVFGDDIIVPTHVAQETMNVLVELGFRVNRDKSFFRPECWFRESCGTEYCDGFDVTPMRVSRKYAHSTRLESASGYVDLANRAYLRGYRVLRQFFLRRIQATSWVPLFGPTSLLGDNYTNYHTSKKWNRHLQRIECKTTCLISKPEDRSDESIRLRHWFESTQHRFAVGDGYVSNVGRTTVLFQRRWSPKHYELSDQQFIDERVQRGRKTSAP